MTPSAVGVTHYAPLGAAGIVAPMGPFCKPHVQRGVMIIAMTANTFKEDVESALNAGMTGFVSKPIDVAYLYQELNSVLSNSKRD